MHTSASPSALPEDAFNFSKEDLESMRLAFRRACDENPFIAGTAQQRCVLAQAIVNRYQRDLRARFEKS